MPHSARGNFEDKKEVMWRKGLKAVTKNGRLGDPRKAEANKGEEYLELWAERMVGFIRK